MKEVEIGGRLYLPTTDNLLKRITKSKLDYYKEGMVSCGDYYNIVIKKMINKFSDQKELLHSWLHEKDVLVNILREQVKDLKEKFAQKKKNDKEKYSNSDTEKETDINEKNELSILDSEELLELINSICREDYEILCECSELEKEYCNENVIGIGGVERWLF